MILAGALSFPDALRIVRQRGLAMAKATEVGYELVPIRYCYYNFFFGFYDRRISTFIVTSSFCEKRNKKSGR